MKNKYLTHLLVVFLLLSSFRVFSTTYYSIASTGWTTPSTWSTVSCGGAAAGTAPGAGDDVVICAGTTVIMDGSGVNCNSLNISGTVNWTAALTTNVGAGGITINSGGNITGTVAGILTTTGGLILNATLTSTTVIIKTITTPGQTISGTGTLGRLDISANTTNNGSITVSTLISSTVLSTLSQGAGATLRYNGTSAIAAGLNASAVNNTVIYGGANQTVKSATYYHFTSTGSGTKTLGGAITINGNLAINSSELYSSFYQIIGNATGTLTMNASGTLSLGHNGSPSNVLFPTNFIASNISFPSTSVVYYYGNSAQTISSVPTYGVIRIMSYAGAKAADGNIVASTIFVTSPTVLDMSSYTLTVSNSLSGTGGLSFTTGTFNIAGSFTNSGSFTCGTGTVNYNGVTQNVKSTIYNHLIISGSGVKTLSNAITVNGNLAVNAGTLDGSTYQITGNVSGTFTMAASTNLHIGANGYATNINFPTNFTSSNITLAATSSVYYNANAAQTISSLPTYGNLFIRSYSGSKPADGAITVTGDLQTISPCRLDMSTYTLNVSGDYSGTGALSFSSGIYNLGGSYTNTGTFTCGTGTVNYNGNSIQTVRGVNYNNLIFSGAGTKSLQAAAIIGIAGTFTRGTMTVTPGATNTVNFNGGAQVMTGSATTFTNLTFNNTSLTAPSDFTVNSTLTINTPAVLNMTSYTLSVQGNYLGTGALTFSSGTFNLSGSYTNSGAFTCGTGTVNYNGSSSQTIKGLNYYHLIFSGTGSKTLQASATIGIAGDFTRGTMTVTPGASNSVIFNGTNQNMTGNATSFTNATINNTSLTIGSSITVNTSLTFTSGTIITGSNAVIISSSGTVSRTSGHVVGNLTKNIATGSSVNRTFEIGSSNLYTPLTTVFTTVTTTGNFTASTTNGDHPAIGTSGFDASLTVNRYWTLTNSLTVFTNYSVIATFDDTDKDPGLNTTNCYIKIYDGSSWIAQGTGTQGTNSSQALGVTIPTTPNTAYIQIGEVIPTTTGKLYSIATGNWNTPGTWSETSGGVSCGCVPSFADTVYIENNFIVTMNATSGNARGLTIRTGGVANWSSAVTTNIGPAGITIASTGDITGAAIGVLTTSGGLTINKVLSTTGVIIRTQTSSQVISGTGTLPKLDISVNTQNNGNITITNSISSTTPSTLTQGPASTLTYTGAGVIAPTLDASTNSNTFIYGGAAQIVKATTYHNMTVSGSSTKTLAGAITINGNLLVSSSELYSSYYQITGNTTGTLVVSAGAILTMGNNGSSSNSSFPTNFTSANISLSPTSTVYYYGNNAQVISSVPLSYGRLTIQSFSGSKSADGNINVAGILTVLTPTILNMSSNTLSLASSFNGTGGLSFTTGTLNISGAYSNTGTFACGTGLVNYNGNAGQTVRGVNYYNLTFSGTGTKTLQTASTIGIAGNFARGSMTVSPGATNTVLFNGVLQNMTGSGTNFSNVIINNTSLTIASNIIVSSTLNFTAGNIVTGSNTVVIFSTGSVLRTSGHVVGNLMKNVAIGTNVSRTFEVGTGTDYTPLTFVFASVSSAGNLTVVSTIGDHPSVATSGFNSALTVNRYWTLTNSGLIYTNYSVTANFVDADKDTGINTSLSVIKLYNGSTWSLPAVGTQSTNSTQATGVTIPVTPNTVYLQIGQKFSSTGNLYSIASNTWSSPLTWSETYGGPVCGCLPGSNDNIYIENNFTVEIDDPSASPLSLSVSNGGVANWSAAYTTDVGNGGITIGATGNLTSSAPVVLTTKGGLTLNTTLTNSQLTIKTITTANQTISGTGGLTNLEIGVSTINSGTISLTDVLTVSNGTFTNSGTFTLKADATKYARIAPVCVSCDFSGNFVVERYIPSRNIGTWADLSSPVTASTMQDWDNELFMSYPFTGFDPNSNRPTGTNVLAYDEPSANYYELNSASVLAPGKGFEIGLTDDATLATFSNTTLTTTGTPNYGTFNIALSYTAGNGPPYPIGYSGENLIGNPYASAISLADISIVNALSTVDVFDYTIDNYKTLSGTDLIGPYQGFWAYAQGTGSSFTITENSKSTDTATPIARSLSDNKPYLNLTLASADETHHMAHTLKIACNENSNDNWDQNDHPFRKSLNPKAPSITANADNILLSISTFNSNHETYIMPLSVNIGIDGKYKITSSDVQAVTNDFKAVFLEDKLTKQFIDLKNTNNYVFDGTTNDSKERFAVHFSRSSTYKPVSSSVVNNSADQVEILQNITGNSIRFNFSQTERTVISVMDMLGRNILESQSVEANKQSISLTLPENFHGMYLIVVQSETAKTVKKFIAE